MFNGYFRIPVLKDDQTYMVLDRSVPEQIRRGSDYHEMGAVGVCWEDKVYFTFDAHTYQGNLVPEENRYAAITECGCMLWIFTREGLVYTAEYTASLGQQPKDTSAKCRVQELGVFWG